MEDPLLPAPLHMVRDENNQWAIVLLTGPWKSILIEKPEKYLRAAEREVVARDRGGILSFSPAYKDIHEVPLGKWSLSVLEVPGELRILEVKIAAWNEKRTIQFAIEPPNREPDIGMWVRRIRNRLRPSVRRLHRKEKVALEP